MLIDDMFAEEARGAVLDASAAALAPVVEEVYVRATGEVPEADGHAHGPAAGRDWHAPRLRCKVRINSRCLLNSFTKGYQACWFIKLNRLYNISSFYILFRV